MIRVFQQRQIVPNAGFQSPADDYGEGRLDIRDLLVIDPENTHYAYMEGTKMQNYNVHPGDILIIDKSVKLLPGAIAIFSKAGMFYTRYYEKTDGRSVFLSDQDEMSADDIILFGVVIASCRGHLPVHLKKGKYRRVCTL